MNTEKASRAWANLWVRVLQGEYQASPNLLFDK